MNTRSQTITRTAAWAAVAATVGSLAFAAPADPASAAPAVGAASRVAARSADIDGDGRADRVTVSHFNRRDGYDTFKLSVRTGRGRTASTTFTVAYIGVHRRPTVSDVLIGTAPADGVRGNEILVDRTDDHAEVWSPVAYTWRGGKLAVMPMPGARQGIWSTSFSPLEYVQEHFFTQAGGRYLRQTHLERSRSGRYYGTATTYAWKSQDWVKVGSTALSGITARRAAAMPEISGITFR